MRLFLFELARVLVVLVMFSVTSLSTHAAIVVSSETVTAAPGSTGYVQILLRNDFGTSQMLSAFSVDLALSGSGVSFTSLDDLTNPAYVFDGFGTGSLTFDPFPNTGFIASDVSLNLDGFVSLLPGETYGLARIGFDVASLAAAGLRPITFTTGATSQFLDQLGTPYAVSDVAFNSGGVNIQGVSGAVPEPTSALIFLINVGCGIFVTARRSRHRTAM